MSFKFVTLVGAAASLVVATTAVATTTDTSANLVQVTATSWNTYTFVETGFSEGATVTGSFTGTNDGEGQVSTFNGAVTAFSMYFSGNSNVSSFSVSLPGLIGLVYNLDGSSLGDGAGTGYLADGIAAIGADGSTWMVGPGTLELCDGVDVCGEIWGPPSSTGGTGTLGGAPEPTSWILMLLGFAGVGGRLRMSRRRVETAA